MKGISRPAWVAAVGAIGLALAGWGGPHVVAGVSHIGLTAATQQHYAAARPAAIPTVEPTERADLEPKEPREVEPTVKPSPAPTSFTSTGTFILVGGTVTLSCFSSGSIIVDLLTPNTGFSARVEHEDDGQEVEVRFEGGSHESRLEAACVGGQVELRELREESS